MTNVLRAFFRAPSGKMAAILAIGLISIALITPLVLNEPATKISVARASQGPSAQAILGTDRLGRDILARTLTATGLSLGLALMAAGLGALLGAPAGAVISLLSPRLRTVAMRIIDILYAFPTILLAIFVTAILSPGPISAVVAVGIAFAPGFARVSSTLATSVAGREYIAGARVIGLSHWRILRRYILPNIAETMVISTFTSIGTSLVAVSSLSFLGMGVQAPAYDWGRMLIEGVQSIYQTPIAALTPAVAIATTGLAVGFMGEALAHAMNPLLWTQGAQSSGDDVRGAWTGATLVNRIRRNGTAPSASHAVSVGDKPLLHVKGLTVRFLSARGVLTAVNGVSFDVAEGEIVGIVGESGSGKSVTALALAQLVPYPGSVSAEALQLRGEDLLTMPHHRLQKYLGTHLAMVFQDPMSSLNPALRIGTQLIEPAQIHQAMSRRQATTLAVNRMRDVHIPAAESQLQRFPHEFSGGMRQRTMLAMGLMSQPSLIITDEPTTALDVTIQAQIIDLLKELNQEYGTGIILISHDMAVISEICSRVLVMYAGRIVEDISTVKLLSEPTHPYTQGLMGSIPALDADRDQPLTSIPGRPPDLDMLPPGCAFAPRCPYAVDRCRAETPALEEVLPGHRIACWVAKERLSSVRNI